MATSPARLADRPRLGRDVPMRGGGPLLVTGAG